MANTNAAGIKYLSDGNESGVSMSNSASSLEGFHGKATAQISNISTVTSSITSDGITAGFDALVTAVNASIAAMTNKGLVASS